MNLLAIKYVDEVIIGAPWSITDRLIKQLNISIVVEGSIKKTQDEFITSTDPYKFPKE